MEDIRKIEELLEKYYNGETSLEEERTLHWFFQTCDVPPHLKPDADIFRYHYHQRTEEVSPSLEEKLVQLLDDQEYKKRFLLSGRTIRLVSAIAASVIIVLALWIGVGRDMLKEQQVAVYEDTYDDPQVAYMETKKALLLVSEKLNDGTKNLKYLKTYNESVNMLEPVLSFGTGIKRLEKLSKFNETTELITKK